MTKTTVKKIPALRFPEFTGEWEEKRLGDLTENGFSNGVFNDPKKVGRGYRLINVKDMYVGDSINIDDLTLVDIDEKEFNRNKVEYGDIFFTRSSLVKEGIAHTNVVLDYADDLTYDGHLIRMRPKQKIVWQAFLAYFFRTSVARRQFIVRGKTTTMTTIGQDDISTVIASLPPLPEQQKIAAFLTAVDTRIRQLTRKKTLLEQYKKGVMQQIFSQAKRFKDDQGKAFPDWEEKPLGTLTYKVGKRNKQGTNLPIYSINNKEGFLPQSDQFDGVDSNERGYNTSLYKVVNANTFAYNPARINVGSIGYSGNLNEVIVSSLYVCFKTKQNLDDYYLLAYLGTFEFNKSVLRNAEGGVRSYLFYENFSNIKIPLPSLPEQQKIAAFLSALDVKIDQVGQQLARMQTFKKGLLQQMFV